MFGKTIFTALYRGADLQFELNIYTKYFTNGTCVFWVCNPVRIDKIQNSLSPFLLNCHLRIIAKPLKKCLKEKVCAKMASVMKSTFIFQAQMALLSRMMLREELFQLFSSFFDVILQKKSEIIEL